MSLKQKYLEGLYGKPTPLTGACVMCGVRVRIRKDGTAWSHRRKPSKPVACQGLGWPRNPAP